jgi:hypothetical protein
MDFITIDDIKVHLRLDDIVDEDEYLESLGNAAEGLALSKVNRAAEDITELGSSAVSQFKLLVLTIVADLYAQRESTASVNYQVTPAALGLICSLRKLKVVK